ncbi:MAG: NERD domain-containing protein [Vicinamibacterales bacterium]
MARLIPSVTDDHTSPGERAVFNLLAAGPDDWVALHSLDLAPWNRGLRTEIDFVVIVPDTGLLCVEVKSHETIAFKDDRWHPAEIRRSPFKQAADARHTLFRRLRDVAPQFRHVPVVHCCIFSRARFELHPNLSVQPWELLDVNAFGAFRTGAEFCADLRTRMRLSIETDQNLEPMPVRLSRPQVEAIIGACLPVQRNRPTVRDEIARRERDVERILRDQQKPILELVDSNARVVVNGGAGTGKTLIAMEVARRAADRGRRVALLCFNQLVGDWMARQCGRDAAVGPSLIVGRAIRVMAELSDVQLPAAPSALFWDDELPALLEERLTDPEFEAIASFDYLVLDEAQDLLARPRLWECLARFLHGGVARGTFVLFGDFDNQVLGERDAMNHTMESIRESAAPAFYRLTENCRNYRIIGESAVRLSGFGRTVYTGYLRSGGGIHNYDISFYADNREQEGMLGRLLRDFKAQGYRPGEISVLSFCAPQESVAAKLAMQGFRLRPAWQQAVDSIGYTSVQAFKGMENKVVILTDVVLGAPDFHRDLFYTGLTRACETVRVLCSTTSKDALNDWLTRKASE